MNSMSLTNAEQDQAIKNEYSILVMVSKWLKFLLCFASVCIAASGVSQIQSCPANINFSSGDLSFWSARTGLVSGASQNYPAPNNGVTTIPEYTISSNGIRVITTSTADKYGGFPTIPTINGYAYNYSVQLGSTATSHDLNSTDRNPGGFTRAITYTINVPAGSTAVPYTMTYAYAMVLENGTHNSNEQPLFKATLSTNDSVITCASPQYYLPTFNNGGWDGAIRGTPQSTDNFVYMVQAVDYTERLFLKKEIYC